jgi:acetolactate synthase-1/2/3 large subunit
VLETQREDQGVWGRYPAEEWSDAIVAAMKLGGVSHLFFVSGSEMTFFQEAIAKAEDRETPAPKLVTMMHESVTLNAAIGTSMVTGQPAASSTSRSRATRAASSATTRRWTTAWSTRTTPAS